MSLLLRKFPGKQREITFLDAALADFRLQRRQRRTFFREDEHAARIAIEPMRELERFARPRGAQEFDRSEADAAAAVAGDSRRLVDDEEIAVLVQDGRLDPRSLCRGRDAGLGALGLSYRRNADGVAGGEPQVGLCALPVDADPAGAQQSIDEAFRDPFQACRQEVIDALAIPVLGHLDGFDARSRGRIAKTRRSLCLH